MPERPLECSQCKKPIQVIYKEIANDQIIETHMCSDCPILQHKLHGELHVGPFVETGLCCLHCQTHLEAVTMGTPLGCAECYSIFGDILVGQLISEDRIPPSVTKALEVRRAQPIHIGKTPIKAAEITLSSRLSTLNEALNEAIKKENYEQAAWLRDQIKALTEKQSNGKS